MMYIAACDCPEIQGLRKLESDSRFYIKEDIWGYSDDDTENRKKQEIKFAEWYNKKYPDKPPHQQDTLLEVGNIVICCEGLGIKDSNDMEITAWPAIKNYLNKFIWLPRQEDIQEMLKPRFKTELLMLEVFYKWISDPHKNIGKIVWESPIIEAWLMFYMNTVHNKRWIGEKWK